MPEPASHNDGLTIGCPICGTPFAPSGRRRYCSDTCRQAAWRRRHPSSVPATPSTSPRPSTVYACPVCDARYLGEQRCSDCNTFARRVGPGGLCPHCDEPVAVSDLLIDGNGGGTPRR
jgi:hypothetical protein